MSDVLRFPNPKPSDQAKARDLALDLRPPMPFETIDAESTRSLLKVVQDILKKSKELIDLVDTDREIAKQVGIETITIELSVMMFSSRLDRVLDALESASVKGKPSQISMEGLYNIRRMERLIAEANKQLSRNTGKQATSLEKPVILSQANLGPTKLEESNKSGFWVPLLIIGGFWLGVIVVAALVTSGREESAS